MMLLRRFATEAARENARVNCERLIRRTGWGVAASHDEVLLPSLPSALAEEGTKGPALVTCLSNRP